MNGKQAHAIITSAIERIETGRDRYSCFALSSAMAAYWNEAVSRGEGFKYVNLCRMYTHHIRLLWLTEQIGDLNWMGPFKRVWFMLRHGKIKTLPDWWDSAKPCKAERIAALRAFRDFMVATL